METLELPDEMEDRPAEDDYAIGDAGRRGYSVCVVGGKHLGDFKTREEAEDAIRAHSLKNQWRPNVWSVSDHGNWHMVESFDWGYDI